MWEGREAEGASPRERKVAGQQTGGEREKEEDEEESDKKDEMRKYKERRRLVLEDLLFRGKKKQRSNMILEGKCCRVLSGKIELSPMYVRGEAFLTSQ